MSIKPSSNWQKFSQTILAFVANLVPKKVSKGFSILLAPCCDITAKATWTCTATNVATLVLTLSRPVGLYADGTYRVNVANGATIRTYTGTFTDGATITTTTVATPGGGGTVTITGNLFYPTNTDGTIGVYISIPSFTSTVSCP